MSLEADLTRNARREPGESLQSLMLADYLERRGDGRAEYIRWSHAALSARAESEIRQARSSIDGLLDSREREWAEPLPGRASWWSWSAAGVDAIEMNSGAGLDARAVLERHPIHDLSLADLKGGLPADWKTWTAELASFRFRAPAVGDMGLARVLASGDWPCLESLELRAAGAGQAATSELTGRGILQRLASLDVSRSPGWGDRSLALLGCQGAARLRRLDISQTNITANGILNFLSNGPPMGLEHLAMATSAPPTGLLNPAVAALGRALAAAPCLGELKALDISGWKFAPDFWDRLSGSALAGNLTELRLAGCGLGTEGSAILREPSGWGSLRAIDLSENGLGPASMALLASSPLARALSKIELSGNPISDKGIAHLLDSPWGETPCGLGLRNCAVGDKGIAALAGLGANRLTGLAIGGNPVGGKALSKLLSCDLIKDIHYLDIARMPAELAIVDALARADTPPLLAEVRIDSDLLRAFLARGRLWAPPSARWVIEGRPDRHLAGELFRLGAREAWFTEGAGLPRRFRRWGAPPAS